MSNTVAKYQKYAEYQDSGIEWLGEIPSHWYTVSLKMLIDVRDGTHDTPSYVEPNFSTYPLVTSKDVTSGRVDLSECKHISEFDYLNIIKRSGVSKGDILMPMIGTVGSPVLVEEVLEIAIKNLALFKTSISNEKLNSKFLFYFLNSEECEIQFSLEGKGGVQNFVSLGTLRNLVLPLTKINEQTQIANFLDHETAKIDSLIAKQEKLIELLKEKRQAVISHAVTKGLNPDVNMKDSGGEWLGQVPEHWAITSVRNLIRSGKLFLQDGNHGELHPTANDYVEQGIPFLMANNVRNGNLLMDDVKRIPKSTADKLRIGFAKQGDMLLTHKGTVGEVALVPQEIEEEYWMLTPQVTYYRWNNREFLNQYFYYQFQSISIQNQLEVIGGKQSTRAYVGLIAQGDLIVAIPPIEEQKQIANSIFEKDQSYQQMIFKAESAIELMQERRTALISSAVTGKIDVRNWQSSHKSNAVNKEKVA